MADKIIIIDNFLKPEESAFLNTRPNFSYWLDKCTSKDYPEISNIIRRIWQNGPSYVDYGRCVGVEAWSNLNSKLGVHTDKDEEMFERTGILKGPLYGSIVYYHQKPIKNGELVIYIPETKEKKIIEPIPGRLVFFPAGEYKHEALPTGEVRKSFVTNLWDYTIAKPPEGNTRYHESHLKTCNENSYY